MQSILCARNQEYDPHPRASHKDGAWWKANTQECWNGNVYGESGERSFNLQPSCSMIGVQRSSACQDFRLTWLWSMSPGHTFEGEPTEDVNTATPLHINVVVFCRLGHCRGLQHRGLQVTAWTDCREPR